MNLENPKYQIIKNGIFIPKGKISEQDLVYDSNYEIVTESCLLRGDKKSENISNPPEFLSDSLREKVKRIDGRLLFMGQFMHEHYGHLLTEGISRYWFIMQNPQKNWKIPSLENPFSLKKLVKNFLKPSKSRWNKFMKIFNIVKSDILVLDSPVSASEIIVPHPSMYNRFKILNVHFQVTKKFARKMVSTSKIINDPTPVYLSRTKLRKKSRHIWGEKPIENYCRKKGFKIVYPEKLSLKEQIILFNKHNIFIGCIGSAFHSIFFRFVDKKAHNIYLAGEGENNPNYELIDVGMGNISHYIHCWSAVKNEHKVYKINQQKVFDYLSDSSKILLS